jgi:hypothetical protein
LVGSDPALFLNDTNAVLRFVMDRSRDPAELGVAGTLLSAVEVDLGQQSHVPAENPAQQAVFICRFTRGDVAIDHGTAEARLVFGANPLDPNEPWHLVGGYVSVLRQRDLIEQPLTEMERAGQISPFLVSEAIAQVAAEWAAGRQVTVGDRFWSTELHRYVVAVTLSVRRDGGTPLPDLVAALGVRAVSNETVLVDARTAHPFRRQTTALLAVEPGVVKGSVIGQQMPQSGRAVRSMICDYSPLTSAPGRRVTVTLALPGLPDDVRNVFVTNSDENGMFRFEGLPSDATTGVLTASLGDDWFSFVSLRDPNRANALVANVQLGAELVLNLTPAVPTVNNIVGADSAARDMLAENEIGDLHSLGVMDLLERLWRDSVARHGLLPRLERRSHLPETPAMYPVTLLRVQVLDPNDVFAIGAYTEYPNFPPEVYVSGPSHHFPDWGNFPVLMHEFLGHGSTVRLGCNLNRGGFPLGPHGAWGESHADMTAWLLMIRLDPQGVGDGSIGFCRDLHNPGHAHRNVLDGTLSPMPTEVGEVVPLIEGLGVHPIVERGPWNGVHATSLRQSGIKGDLFRALMGRFDTPLALEAGNPFNVPRPTTLGQLMTEGLHWGEVDFFRGGVPRPWDDDLYRLIYRLRSDSPRWPGGNNFLGDGSPIDNELEVAFEAHPAHGFKFRRGDANEDGQVDLADAVATLHFLFLGDAARACLDALDADDSGVLNLSDPIFTLGALFLGGAPPPPPNTCGVEFANEEDPFLCRRHAPNCG